MEFMKIDGFLARAASKLINKGVEAKIGFKPNLEILNLGMSTGEDEDEIKVSLEAVMTKTAFEKLISEVTK